MPYWESMQWPLFMGRAFVSFSRIVQNITGWGHGNRVCVLAGDIDAIVTPDIAEANAKLIRDAVKEQAQTKKIEGLEATGDAGVQFVVAEKAPHHFQNDLTREEAAGHVLEFLQQLG